MITQNDDGDDVEVVVPGWSAITGQKLSEKEVSEATKETTVGETTATEEPTKKDRTNAPQAAINALKADPTEEKKKMFKDKYGYLPKEI